jgi:formate hydrogenlyase transcriptional activator
LYRLNNQTTKILGSLFKLPQGEKEETILLSLTTELAAVSSRNDLLSVLTHKLKELFPITDFGIRLIDETFIADGVIDRILRAEGPIFLRVDALAGEAGAPDYVRFWQKKGYAAVLGIPLRTGDNLLGCLLFHLAAGQYYAGDDLLKGVSAQISVAVSRIRSAEEIVKREEEKSILLSFTDEIAATQTRKDFFEVVITKIKKTFAIEFFGIAKINEDQETVSSFIPDSGITGPLPPDHTKIVSDSYPLSDPLFARAMALDAPGQFGINEFTGGPGSPAYTGYWKKEGLGQVATIALRVAGKAIGFAILHVDNLDKLHLHRSLLQGICAQLAVKVSQILAYEEIEKREREKSMLLAFSNAIAAERNKTAFAKMLKQQLKALFDIEDFTMHALSDDKKYHTPILFDPNEDFATHPDFSKLVNHWTDVNDGVFNVTLASPDPVTFDVEEWTHWPTPPPYAEAAKAIGLKKMTGVALRLGQENIGVMNFRQDGLNESVIQDRLFRSICSQIAITLANIIANEKVDQQLSEIKKYKEQLEEERIYLKEEIETSINYTEIVGESAELKKVFRLIAQVAYTDSTVLLLGETGTGKELMARAIHHSSPRKSKLMIKVNCTAIPASLIESELFGHERGSFTGAVERRIGKFELADNGTLFLDEIGEMSLDVQVKLLRALQEKEIERVGGKTTIKTNVRIIAATNRDLDKLMEEGKFRSDLYYRLNTFPIMIPPLKDRKEDIPKLALHFIDRYSKKSGKKIKAIHNKVLQEMMQYDWPGNIRELEHLIERSVLLTTGDSINEVHLPHQKRNLPSTPDKDNVVIKTIKENEREHILKVLKYVNGRIGGKGGAAELLGVPTSTLNSRIKKLGIRKEHM